ncbi:MAG TPA: hypothetical protein VL282_14635 [Tepidisphaeraceae bacterium]|jgi:hypothetical protein|nr:hypothetical protein [Tepidisphaeraceae bacterium]
MGSGTWSPATYFDRADARVRAGRDVFDYSKDAIRSGHLRVHQTLDPQGLGIRESRDSAEHPDSNSIIISLDVTGSMDRVVRGIHADLPRLHELLLGHRYIPHPQILFAAVGDATCDRVPLQVGQFESDNRMDQNLENIILEGGGGGQKTESYELMLYVAARHTAIDCWDKRQRKGYLFMIGDEMAYDALDANIVRRVFGGGMQASIPTPQLVAEVKERYHLYFVIPGGASHGTDSQVLRYWRNLVGESNVLRLDNPSDTSECIGLTIGVNEGAIGVEQGIEHLKAKGVVERTIDAVRQALGNIVWGGAKPPAPRSRHL